MARKKNRSRHSNPTETAVVAQPQVTGITAKPAPAAVVVPVEKIKKEERFWLEVVAIRISRVLGSLQMAVILLAVFALVLMVGTCVESWYTGRIAQELVYRTWWFSLLLALLWINIFFAAAKKYPWKKHQTGFLITHLGLLTMVFGGLLNSLQGTDALMTLLDTGMSNWQSETGMKQSGSTAINRDDSQITVKRVKGGKDQAVARSFQPGALAWRGDDEFTPHYPALLTTLDWLAHPLPRFWSADVGGGAQLEVLAYYPHARKEPYSPAGKEDKDRHVAVKFTLISPMFGSFPEKWVSSRLGGSAKVGPSLIDCLGRCPEGFLDVFRNPPMGDELGKKGQLVFRVEGKNYPLNVDKCLGGADQPLGQTGWKVRVSNYVPDFMKDLKEVNPGDPPTNPDVQVDLTAPDGKTSSWHVLARPAGQLFPAANGPQDKPTQVQIWYNPPDYRFGEAVRAVLQFVAGDDDKLYYRSFNSHKGEFAFETAGRIDDLSEEHDIWKGMNWKFRVNEFLPRAAFRPRWVPQNLRPGLEDVPGVTQAIRCRITAGKDASEEFWVGRDEHPPKEVAVGNERFQVSYQMETFPLGFEMKLLRADEGKDPGTQQPSTYSSWVQLTDKDEHIEAADAYITMNQPLHHRGYKFYQSGYRLLGLDDVTYKPVSFSTFTVASDPGLWFKYIGSTMLALGIFIMFYMKAYFFKPRGRKAVPAAAAPAQEGLS
jgi:hypothetical protein